MSQIDLLRSNYVNLKTKWDIQIEALDKTTMPFIEAPVGIHDTILYIPIERLSKTEVTSHNAIGIKLIPHVEGCPIYHVESVKCLLKTFLVSKGLMINLDQPFPQFTKSQFLRFTSAPSVVVDDSDINKRITNWLPLTNISQNSVSRYLTQGEMNWFMCRRYNGHDFIDLREFVPDETMPHELGFKDPTCQITVSIDMLNRLYNFFISESTPRQTRTGLCNGGKKLTKIKNQRYRSNHTYKRPHARHTTRRRTKHRRRH